MKVTPPHNPTVALLALLALAGPATAQAPLLVEDFEFASTDAAAASGVIDLTDLANSPAFYISGADENASEGLFSIGTDAVFCQLFCDPGSFIGFRRLVDPQRFVQQCPGGPHFAPLSSTYGDPDHPGALPPDFTLDDIRVITDAYGDGAFADGPTGTHLWINLVDCEGEIYEFINHSETSLYSEFWTFNVEMGRTVKRLSPQSLLDVPDGDRLLTEIAAIEVLIQDADNPPTTLGKWYVDNLRVVEPGALTAAGAGSRYIAVTPGAAGGPVALLVRGETADPDVGCVEAFIQADGQLGAGAVFQPVSTWATVYARGEDIRPDHGYEILVDSGSPGNPQLSEPVPAATWPFGEVDGSLGVDVDDLQCVLDAFGGIFLDCAFLATDTGPCATNGLIDLDDVLLTSDAWLGATDSCPGVCPG